MVWDDNLQVHLASGYHAEFRHLPVQGREFQKTFEQPEMLPQRQAKQAFQ